MYTTLIEPEELAAPLSRNAAAESDWTVLDCRFDLAATRLGRQRLRHRPRSERTLRAP